MIREISDGLSDALDIFMERGCLPFLALFTIGASGLIVYGCTQDKKAFNEFMAQCQEDHKEYECYALWRQGQKSNPAIIPIPIVVPAR